MSRIREVVRNPHDLGGEWITFIYYSEKVKPGTNRKVDVYVPTTVKPGSPCAVLFTMDGPREADPAIIERLSRERNHPAHDLHRGDGCLFQVVAGGWL